VRRHACGGCGTRRWDTTESRCDLVPEEPQSGDTTYQGSDAEDYVHAAIPVLRSDDREIVRPAVLKGLRVLVVDDEADARELMRIVLRSSGAEVMSAASAEEAFEQVEQWHPDILVSDIGLPDVDGYALIQKLRTLEAERGWSIPALAVTAYARVEDRTRALSSGFQMHLAKPLEPADLVAAITSLLGKDRGAATVGT